MWSEGGFRDSRRLWYYKNSFEGGVIYHPPGITRLENGQVVSNKDLARELIEKKRNGGVLTLPNIMLGEQRRAWEYEGPSGNTPPSGLENYGADLRYEIFEALGVPPEVIESPSSEGFGSSSGRKIPLLVFYSTLQELGNWLLHDFDNFILRPLVEINFGPVSYDLIPRDMVDIASRGVEGVELEGKVGPNRSVSEPGSSERTGGEVGKTTGPAPGKVGVRAVSSEEER
jgi:hypothetical protein